MILHFYNRKALTLAAIAVLLLSTAAFVPDCAKSQPKTVADTLHTMGNIKRQLKTSGEITAQQDADISRKLDAMNRSYRQFVTDEQARIAAGTPDPSARARALSELRSLLNGLTDPSVLGIKSQHARELWADSIATLNTILAGFGG